MIRCLSILLLAVLAMSTTPPPTETTTDTHHLTVAIQGLKPGKGHVMIAVYNSEKDFMTTFLRNERVKAPNSSAMALRFDNLPAGTYAVAVYQDISGNEQLDTGLFGVPVEPYGFSNNPPFGRPSFEKSKFTLRADKTITIQLR